MTDNANQLAGFKHYMSTVVTDEKGLQAFADAVSGPESLRSYAAAHGYVISSTEAEQVFTQARDVVDASAGESRLSDEALDGVNGGISLAGIGAIIGGVGAAGALTLAVGAILAPATGGASLVGALAGLSAGAAASVGAGAVAAGAVGAGVGALGGLAVENS